MPFSLKTLFRKGSKPVLHWIARTRGKLGPPQQDFAMFDSQRGMFDTPPLSSAPARPSAPLATPEAFNPKLAVPQATVNAYFAATGQPYRSRSITAAQPLQSQKRTRT